MAMLTVETILAGKPVNDVWRVDQDSEYLETGTVAAEKTLAPTGA